MEAAIVKALESFGPAAIIIGIPCGLVIRALWQALQSNTAATISALSELKAVLEVIKDRMPRQQ